MKYVFEDHYPLFKCLASKCPDTCCRGWEIIIDPESYEKYKNLDSPFGRTIISNTAIDNENDAVFVQKNGRCPFLNEKNLCDIIINEDESALCEVCRQHPRFVEEYGEITEIGLSLSCPEVIGILKNKSEPTLLYEEITDEEPEYVIDDPLLGALFEFRNTVFKIINEHDLAQSLSLIYSLSLKFQGMIDRDDYSRITSLTPESTKTREYDYFSVLSSLEILTDKWKRVLSTEKNEPETVDENNVFIKNILSYFVYRYIPKAINDGDIVSKAEFIIFSIKAILHFASRNRDYDNQKDKIAYVARLYSKEIEHDPDNTDSIMILI